jgi:hypothetical protein
MTDLTQSRLKELLHYDPETGDFIRLVSTNSRVKAGDIAGGLNSDGYVMIRVDGFRYSAHRLAFLYMLGEMPEWSDHHDLNRSNNRWSNLRIATRSQNQANQRVRQNNRLGVKGVHINRYGKYAVSIRANGAQHYLGQTDDLATAIAIYQRASVHYYGEFARAA